MNIYIEHTKSDVRSGLFCLSVRLAIEEIAPDEPLHLSCNSNGYISACSMFTISDEKRIAIVDLIGLNGMFKIPIEITCGDRIAKAILFPSPKIHLKYLYYLLKRRIQQKNVKSFVAIPLFENNFFAHIDNIKSNDNICRIVGWAKIDGEPIHSITLGDSSQSCPLTRVYREDVLSDTDYSLGFDISFETNTPPERLLLTFRRHGEAVGLVYIGEPERLPEPLSIKAVSNDPIEISIMSGFHFGLDHIHLYHLSGTYIIELKGWTRPHSSTSECSFSVGGCEPLLFDRYFRQDVCDIFGEDSKHGFIVMVEVPDSSAVAWINFNHNDNICKLMIYTERLDCQQIDGYLFTTGISRCMGNLDDVKFLMDDSFIFTGWMYTSDLEAISCVSSSEFTKLPENIRPDLSTAFPDLRNIEKSAFSYYLIENKTKCAALRLSRNGFDIICVANLHEIKIKTYNETRDSMSSELLELLEDCENAKNMLNSISTKYSEQAIPRSEKYIQLKDNDIKYIAFYLPQYHPFPENDLFWGTGFTEWTNVTKAVPLFNGHYQPKLPADLGFYDLRFPDVQRKQAELACQYGVYGMCYYYYWFDGRAIMDTPLKNLLMNKDIPQKFCLCWANENWSRRWDGLEHDIILAQNHTPEDDILFIESILPAITDERYIQVDGKPLLLIYRPKLFPDIRASLKRWRSFFSEYGELYIIGVMGFGYSSEDAMSDGFDAALESQPQNMYEANNISAGFKTVIPRTYGAAAYDLPEYLHKKNYMQKFVFPTHKCVFPEWDNTARKGTAGSIQLGGNPKLYQTWLEDVSCYTAENFSGEKRIVFINAWNEWAEGAYLEPDKKYGFAYLEATQNALLKTRELATYLAPKQKGILVWGHDAYPHGAQFNLLAIITRLKNNFNFNVHLIMEDASGSLLPDYQKVTQIFEAKGKTQNEIEKHLKFLRNDMGAQACLTNTVVSGSQISSLKRTGFTVISLIHEMEDVIRRGRYENNAVEIAKYSDKIVFASNIVAKSFQKVTRLKASKRVICPQGSYFDLTAGGLETEARNWLRACIGAPENSYIVLNVGYVYQRKGGDLFVKAAQSLISKRDDIYFVWVGTIDQEHLKPFINNLSKKEIQRIHFLGEDRDIARYYKAADIFWLTSREDPFPTVVMEAMLCGLPVVGFERAGGFTEIVNAETGRLVPYLNYQAMAQVTFELLEDRIMFKEMCKNCRVFSENRFSFDVYVYNLLELLGYKFEKVSVIVPNFNYAKYLPGRIASIINQKYPIYEIIFMDDASSDNSTEVMNDLRKQYGSRIKLVFNTQNSGNVYAQWVKGMRMAKGDYIWIAEADDLCMPLLLERNMNAMMENDAVLAYCESCAIDENGNVTIKDYRDYNHEISPGRWLESYCVDGAEEIRKNLAVRNSIMNASACLFKKKDISPIADELTSTSIVGDWKFYIWMLENGKIAYNADIMNMHRRHTGSVTSQIAAQKHYDEIVKMQETLLSKWDAPIETKEKAAKYQKTLRTQFNLTTYN